MLERAIQFQTSEMPQLVFSWTSIKVLQPAYVLFITIWFLTYESSFSIGYSLVYGKLVDLDTILNWGCRSWHMVVFQVSDLLSVSLSSALVWSYLIYSHWNKICSDHPFVNWDNDQWRDVPQILSYVDFTHLWIIWPLYAICSVFFPPPRPSYHEFHGCVNCKQEVTGNV